MKAFDKVPHLRLIHKLQSYGIQGPVKAWITDFLSERKQSVVVNGTASSWKQVTSGIPQGSVLGPTLFVIYINDLPNTVKSDVFLFADDTKIFTSLSSQQDAHNLQNDLNSLHNWTEKWLLKFHPEKCKILKIGNHELQCDFYLPSAEAPLEVVHEEKDLGVIFDDHLTFYKHINNQVNKANRIMGSIRRSFSDLNEYNFKTLFVTMVRPHLEYAALIWSPHLKKDITLIENVQRRASKLVPGLKHLPYQSRLEQLGLPTLRFRRHRGDMIEVFKILNTYSSDPASILKQSTSTNTRGHSFKLQKYGSRLNSRHYSFSQRVINHWNNLPDDVVTATNINTFKNRLDRVWHKHPAKYDWEADLSFPVHAQTI